MIKINPLTKKKFERFRSIKRGYISLIIFCALVGLSLVAELFINNKALMVSYQGQTYYPVFADVIPGSTFGFDYEYETNYRDLQKKLSGDDYVIMPLVPYNPLENDLPEGIYPPTAPSSETKHYLGTDTTGRDVLARLVYGFRIAIIFSLVLIFFNYLIGVTLGCIMGFVGGKFDLFFQRIIEIWSNVPFLYIVIIISSIVVPTIEILTLILVAFGWMSMTWYMRTSTYKEKAREYVMAARSLGAGPIRIIFKHILPNTISVIVTFIPFSISSGITSLTALDYLGFGLPAPTPSWGELLKQGTANLDANWIVISVVLSLVCLLMMVTFIGEAIREAFDPKKFTTYR